MNKTIQTRGRLCQFQFIPCIPQFQNVCVLKSEFLANGRMETGLLPAPVSRGDLTGQICLIGLSKKKKNTYRVSAESLSKGGPYWKLRKSPRVQKY